MLHERPHVRRAEVTGGAHEVVEIVHNALIQSDCIVDSERTDSYRLFGDAVPGMVNRDALVVSERLRGECLSPASLKVDEFVDEYDLEVVVGLPHPDLLLTSRLDGQPLLPVDRSLCGHA